MIGRFIFLRDLCNIRCHSRDGRSVHAGARSVAAAVRGVRAEGAAGQGAGGAVLRPLGATIPDAAGLGRAAGGPGARVLRGARTDGRCEDWQVRQAEQALRIYFVNFLQRTDWQRPASTVVDERGHTSPLAALEQLRRVCGPATIPIALNAAMSTGCGGSSTTWPSSKACPIPVASEVVRDYSTHLAVRRASPPAPRTRRSARSCSSAAKSSASTSRAWRWRPSQARQALPVVLERAGDGRAAGGDAGTTWLMAALIYGGGLRVSECCELRIKDLDFDQGLVVRAGRQGRQRPIDVAGGDWGGTNSRPVAQGARRAPGRPRGRTGRRVDAGRVDASTRMRVASWAGSGCFPATRCPPIPGPASCVVITSATR